MSEVKWIWVPIDGDGAFREWDWTEKNRGVGPFRPRIPFEAMQAKRLLPETGKGDPIDWSAHNTFIDLVTPIDERTGTRKCAHSLMRIGVFDDPETWKMLEGWEWYAEDDPRVPFRDKEMLRMWRTLCSRFDRHEEVEEYFNAVDLATADPSRPREVKDVLLQAVARGFSPQRAERIRRTLNLPEGGRDGL